MKTLYRRVTEIKEISAQISKLGLSDHEGVEEFYEITKEYIKTGKPCEGSIALRGTKRTLVYMLSGKNDVPCSVTLSYDDSGV